MIGFIIPFVFIIIIGAIRYTNSHTLKPEEVFNQLHIGKNLGMQQYNDLSSENKREVQTLIKDRINSIYESGDDKKLDIEILSYNDISELKDYINRIEQKVKYRKVYNEAQEIIDKANGINNLKDYEWLMLLERYCSIGNTFEKYDDVLDKIIL